MALVIIVSVLGAVVFGLSCVAGTLRARQFAHSQPTLVGSSGVGTAAVSPIHVAQVAVDSPAQESNAA